MDGIGYSIGTDEGGKDIRIELHVLARAYRDACLALMLRPPSGIHRLDKLGVTIDFEVPGDA
jgi:hypothetical protein